MARNRYDNYRKNDNYHDDEDLLSLENVDINSYLDDSIDGVIFENDFDDKKNKKHQKDNQNDRRDPYNNPMCKYLSYGAVYDRDDMYNAMVKQDGLVKLIEDLKHWRKDPKSKKPSYVYNLLRNIVFASALPEAVDKLCKKDDFGDATISKSDMDYLMDEILQFLNNSYDYNLIKQYGEDSVESMRKAYINILYKFNKKKVKKFKDIKNMPESMAKQLIVLTAGENVRNTIYRLLKFLYSEVNEFTFNKKNVTKIFKICYGKSNMRDVVKYLMLEKYTQTSGKVADLWIIIDQIIRDELEDMEKKEIEKIIKEYISERKRQERNGRIQRRFGDRRTIHPDDYPKLTKVFENIEARDFSIISYLR